jgi:hypothetical protein
MGWCVERQRSWTADDPYEDVRSVRKQLRGEIEDFHHMEPVLVRKFYLHGEDNQGLTDALDWKGEPIWADNEYMVVAVIKIHFLPYMIRRGDRSTKIIKKFSRTLGTELLSLHIRETQSEAQKDLTRQRLQSCNVLAHELRNTLIKLGFAFSAINAEIGFLREQWEQELLRAAPEIEGKGAILKRLGYLLETRLGELNGTGELQHLSSELATEQRELANLALLPQAAERWLDNKIRPKWLLLLAETGLWASDRGEVLALLNRLERAFWIGLDRDLARRATHLPDDLRQVWPELAYVEFAVDQLGRLEEILNLLDHPALDIPHKNQTKKILTSLKALVEMIPEVEERANRIISSLKNGNCQELC